MQGLGEIVKYVGTRHGPLEVSFGSQVLVFLLAQTSLCCIFDPPVPSSADDSNRDAKGVGWRDRQVEH